MLALGWEHHYEPHLKPSTVLRRASLHVLRATPRQPCCLRFSTFGASVCGHMHFIAVLLCVAQRQVNLPEMPLCHLA